VDPGLIVAIVALILIVISIGVQAVVFRALRDWRERVSGPDQEQLDERSPGARERIREEELRQLLEASSYRREQRGLEPLDVDAELERLLGD
jgi:hypothetical protein